MKRLLVAAFACAAITAQAGAVLTWTSPTTHVNGSPLTPQSGDVLKLTKDGNALATLSGTATTYTDNAAADCALHSYSLTFTETATALTSAAAAATQPVDVVGCAPKPVSGLIAK